MRDGVRPRILIEGGSGTGKTTLGVKLAYDWSKCDVIDDGAVVSSVQAYQLCLVIPLRYYDGSLLNLIQKEILAKSFAGKSTLLEIYDFMKANDDKLLLVLDGWEEIASRNTTSELLDIICGKVFPRSCVVVMSNPGESNFDCLSQTTPCPY